jgi:hypothetical protein
MKRITLLVSALFAVFTLSAQTYKVGDLYNVNGKQGVVFEVSEDGKHGKIINATENAPKMTWYEAMEWGKQLKDGWYLPSHEELIVLLGASGTVGKTLKVLGVKLPYFSWTTTEFNADCAWAVSVRSDSYGGFYKPNKFSVYAVSKF